MLSWHLSCPFCNCKVLFSMACAAVTVPVLLTGPNCCSWSHLFFFLQALLQRSQLGCDCLSLALQLSELLLGCGLCTEQLCTKQVGLGQPAAQLASKPQALLLPSLQLLRCSRHLLQEFLGLLLVSCLVGIGRVLRSRHLQPQQGCSDAEAGDAVNYALECHYQSQPCDAQLQLGEGDTQAAAIHTKQADVSA